MYELTTFKALRPGSLLSVPSTMILTNGALRIPFKLNDVSSEFKRAKQKGKISRYAIFDGLADSRGPNNNKTNK